jgi:hypothetical protein
MARWTARTRFRIEALAAALTGALAAVTLFIPDWIEVVTGTDPDHGNGTLEVLIVLALAVTSVVLTLVARADHRRAALGHAGD